MEEVTVEEKNNWKLFELPAKFSNFPVGPPSRMEEDCVRDSVSMRPVRERQSRYVYLMMLSLMLYVQIINILNVESGE